MPGFTLDSVLIQKERQPAKMAGTVSVTWQTRSPLRNWDGTRDIANGCISRLVPRKVRRLPHLNMVIQRLRVSGESEWGKVTRTTWVAGMGDDAQVDVNVCILLSPPLSFWRRTDYTNRTAYPCPTEFTSEWHNPHWAVWRETIARSSVFSPKLHQVITSNAQPLESATMAKSELEWMCTMTNPDMDS